MKLIDQIKEVLNEEWSRPEFQAIMNEEATPTSPEKWEKAVAAAKRKFEKWPSRVATWWASRKYEKDGGGWSGKEVVEGITPDTVDVDSVAATLGVDFNAVDRNEFATGLKVEREHDDVTGGDLHTAGKIALAHLKEDPKYYTKLTQAGL